MHQHTAGFLSTVSFQFSNTSFQCSNSSFHLGDPCQYVGNSVAQLSDSISCTLEYICIFTNAHKQLDWY